MITKEMLRKIAPNANDQIITHLAESLDEKLIKYNVNTYLRICHFLAQAAHESAGFRTLEEYASGAAYEGRKDLGNTKAGDGVRYKGRGIFQLTGRANYKTFGTKLGYDLENNPKLAASPEISMLTALEYWNAKSLSNAADRDDLTTITRRINGGLNGLDSRKAFLDRAKRVIPKDIKLGVADKPLPPPPINPIVPPIVVAKIGDNSPYIADLQNMLIKKGAAITADGAFGPKTQQAVKDFQSNNGLTVTGSIDTDTLNKLMV